MEKGNRGMTPKKYHHPWDEIRGDFYVILFILFVIVSGGVMIGCSAFGDKGKKTHPVQNTAPVSGVHSNMPSSTESLVVDKVSSESSCYTFKGHTYYYVRAKQLSNSPGNVFLIHDPDCKKCLERLRKIVYEHKLE
jgi:hypothetical protein